MTVSVPCASLVSMSHPAAEHVSVRAFWGRLSTPGRWLLSTTAISTIGRGMTLPFTIIYVHEVRGISLDVAGLLMGLIAVVALVVTGPVGALTDRVGARQVLIWVNAVQVLATTVLAFATTVPAFILGFTLLGISFGAGWPAFNAMIAAIVDGAMRTQYFGVNFALLNLGIGVGGILGGLFADVHRPWTFMALFRVDSVCVCIPIALLLGPLRHVHARAETPAEHESSSPTSYLAIVRQPAMTWMTLLTFVASFVGYGQMEAGFPAFARQVSEVSTRTVGFAFAMNTAVIVLAQFVVLKRILGHRRTRVFLALIALWALSWTIMGATGLVPGTVLAAVGVCAFHVFFGIGETMLHPTMPAIVNDLAADHTRGRYNATTALAFQLGAVAAPASAGFLIDRGLSGVFIAVMLAGLALMVVLTLRLERQISPRVNGVAAEAVSAPG